MPAVSSVGRLSVTHEIRDGYEGADVVYANSWGALPYYGDPESGWSQSRAYVRFIVDDGKMAMTNKAIFSHWLPVRRNVEVTGPGRSELRGDRRGGKPATRTESADAEAAGVSASST